MPAGARCISHDLLAIEYKHSDSSSLAAYRHQFGRGVEIWVLPNGSALIRHPDKPVWDTFTVQDEE